MMIKREELFRIGQFVKPHGIKGEIGLMTDGNIVEESANPYLICEMDGLFVPFFIESYRYKTDRILLVKLENVDSEEAARLFTNRAAYYPSSAVDGDRAVGGMTWDEMIGYTVFDPVFGRLGEITDVDESTMNTLLRVDYKGKELLVPAADELIVSADHTHKTLHVSLPGGLLEL
ncbi:MAG: ribosome maturation factor RimM [Tannerellaceae bacterium]|jgi:16S rRNA processing protein RimM|nr:ribosome maturation factor RimM [Tannerellaceae bacterium]